MSRLVSLLVLGTSVVGCQASGPSDQEPVGKGDRRFGMHVTPAADGNYDAAFQAARRTGMDLMPFGMSWTAVETATGWDSSLLDVANAYFGAQGLPLYFTILSPINTTVAEVPAAYRGFAFDDPRLIAAFGRLLDSVRAHLPSLRIEVLILGNEIDGTLGTDLAAWGRYQTFFEASRARAKALWGPSLAVGATLTAAGLALDPASAAVDRLIAASDLASITYYPLRTDFGVGSPTVAAADFDRVVARVPSQPIYFQEVGYPTSPVLESSEERQREFAAEVFKAWDRHASRVKYIGWLWLTDLSDQQTHELIGYYGVTGAPIAVRFGEFLRTLGTRRHDGTVKPAYSELTKQLAARGW